jgi:predicted NBD/HSP70 family sugar kinase
MDGIRNAALVTISEGIGTAILAEGHLLTGARGLAGEFGHATLVPGGLRCGCGRKGCWEMYASSRAALRYYAESKAATPCSDIVELLNRAEEGDKRAFEALSRQAHSLADGLQLITTALAPELILLTGGLTMLWERFAPIIEADLKKNALAGAVPRLRAAAESEVARLRGAAALVLQRHTMAHHSR